MAVNEDEWIDGPPEVSKYGEYPAGVLLDLRGYGMRLIGHANESLGICNDCTADWRAEDVIRHRFVWSE